MGGSNPSANYALFCLESWNHTIKGMIEANSQKTGATYTTWDKLCSLIGQKQQNTFQ